MVRCLHCGDENPDGRKYCTQCGSELSFALLPLPTTTSAASGEPLPAIDASERQPDATTLVPAPEEPPASATDLPADLMRGLNAASTLSVTQTANGLCPAGRHPMDPAWTTCPYCSATLEPTGSMTAYAVPSLDDSSHRPPVPTVSVPPQTSALPSKFCTACGASNPKTNRDCQICGRPLAVFCLNCGMRNQPADQYCRGCGVKFDPRQRNGAATTVVGGRFLHYVRRMLSFGAKAKTADDNVQQFPFGRERGGYEARVALVESFRFVHEPINTASAFRFVGRQNELESLAERILFSEGGSFLVTGYRGVGKTSFINQVVRKLEEATPWAGTFLGRIEVVDIYLNIARPVQPGELMHYIIRRLYDRLVEKGIYPQLALELQEALALAYQRTSVNMARKLAEASERNFGFNEASIGGDWLKAAVKASWNTKRSRSQNTEMTFLGYDDKTAEHDIITLSRWLSAGYTKSPVRRGRWRRRVTGEALKPIRLKIVFVFDELDKLEEFNAPSKNGEQDAEPAKPVIDQILGALKNLFTTSGVSFVFVAGKDLQERWLEDVGKGDSVYESVFSYDKYLPCMWTDVDGVCDGLVDWRRNIDPYARQVFSDFKKFLAYKGRGIPRRIIRAFNEYVEWGGDYPALAFTRQSLRRIRFFAGLQDALTANETRLFGETYEESSGTQSDKRRLGVYYLIDWMLRQGTAEFKLNDVLNASRRLSAKIALAEEIAPGVIEDMLDILIERDYLQAIEKGLDQVVIGDAAAEKRYRVVPRRLVEIGGLVEERAEEARLFAESEKVFKRIGRYRIIELIGEGGMGKVYKATDEVTGRTAAIKVLNDEMNRQEEFRQRFEREAKVMSALSHPNVVQLYDWGNDAGRLFIAMEFLDGITLEDVISRLEKLSLEFIVPIIRTVALAAQYVHERGFVRNDIKPHNIMLTTAGRICLLDFGITKTVENTTDRLALEITKAGGFVGTPLYSAPEQLERGQADARSDIYSLGVVLYRMLTGVYPSSGAGQTGQRRIDINEGIYPQLFKQPAPPSQYASIPAILDEVTLKCLEKDPNNRYQTMLEVAEALPPLNGEFKETNLAYFVAKIRKAAKQIEAINNVNTLPPADSVIEPPPMSAVPASAYPANETAGTQTGVGAISYDWDAASNAFEIPEAPPMPKAAERPSAPAPVAPTAMAFSETGSDESANQPYLLWQTGGANKEEGAGTAPVREFRLKPGMTIGRSPDNHIVLPDVRVSRHHAIFEKEGEQWLVRDLNSFRGVSVNDQRILDRQLLKDGDLIRLGDSIFLFQWPH